MTYTYLITSYTIIASFQKKNKIYIYLFFPLSFIFFFIPPVFINLIEKESACIFIQKMFKGYQGRKEFHNFACRIIWRKFESLHENITLHNHEEIYKPLIKVIEENIKNGTIPISPKRSSKYSNQMSTISSSSNGYSSCEENSSVPKMKDKIDREFAIEIFHYFLTTKTYVLPSHMVFNILKKTLKMFDHNVKNSLINLDLSNKPEDTKLIVLGDVHGQLNDVLWIFNRFGLPASNNIYVFNGDIADRGENATEIFLLLFVFKLANYDSVIINRGNHECSYMNEVYGFRNEGKKFELG
uniref:Serine/threonine specific protein phosphatases domain-containing protein n=1 Tax=Piliocolobus tephrosceles TaxID=591936 RepID=A0A8C9GRV5_9PRIM